MLYKYVLLYAILIWQKWEIESLKPTEILKRGKGFSSVYTILRGVFIGRSTGCTRKGSFLHDLYAQYC